MTWWTAKTDSNQADIVKALRKAGCSVQSLHDVGRGVPDLLVGRNGVNYLLEVKSEDGKLTPVQDIWHKKWRGQALIVRNPKDALRVVGLWVDHSER